jgi:hypothetical protein
MTTPAPHVSDLFALDRDVSRGAGALARWRAELARDPASAADDAPLEAVRHVTGKSTYDALGELSPSAADVPLRDGLRSWIVALLLARVVGDEDVELARLAHDERGRFGGDEPKLVAFRDAVRGAVAARTIGEVRLWLEAMADVAPRLLGVARRRAEKRVEAVRRLGLAHPWETVVPAKHGAVRAAAARLLDATQDLSEAVVGPFARDGGAAAVLHAVVGRDAGEGWPARLGERWLHDVTGGASQGMRLALGTLPRAVGASSFARALGRLGFAVREASVGKATPFALGREPGARASHRLGAVFASLACDVDWQARTLGIGRRTAHAQVRVLARTALVHARLSAMRLLLGDEATFAPRDAFSELSARVLGASLDPSLLGWPAARDDEPSRFVALLESLDVAVALRDRFDVDWIRNPRAWTHLRAISALPSTEPIAEGALDAAATRLARALEALIG